MGHSLENVLLHHSLYSQETDGETIFSLACWTSISLKIDPLKDVSGYKRQSFDIYT